MFISTFNELAFKALDNFSMNNGSNTLIIYGDDGVGKSELLKRLFTKMQNEPHNTIYYEAQRFSGEYTYALSTGKIKAFRNKVRKADLFILDDLHKLAGKRRTIEELFYTYDSIIMHGGKFAISCSKENLTFDYLGERFASRLLSSVAIPVFKPEKLEIREFIQYCNKKLFFGKIDIDNIISKSPVNIKNTIELIQNFS